MIHSNLSEDENKDESEDENKDESKAADIMESAGLKCEI